MYKFIITKIEDGIATITINREDATNKLNIECMNEICVALKEFESTFNIKVIILASTGQYFCNGGELGDFRKKSPEEIRAFGEAFSRLHITIHKLKKIVIAKVGGKVLGGGFSLLEVCDMAIASSDATFGVPEMTFGLAPMMCLSGVIRSFSRKRAMELAMTGCILDANEALNFGMINKVCEKSELDIVTYNFAKQFIDCNPTAVELTKSHYAAIETTRYDFQFEKGMDTLVSLLLSPNTKEALSAREENRKPIYK